jgi:hypothetical protein
MLLGLFDDQHRNAVDDRINPPASIALQSKPVQMQVAEAGGASELIQNRCRERALDPRPRRGAGLPGRVRHGKDQ